MIRRMAGKKTWVPLLAMAALAAMAAEAGAVTVDGSIGAGEWDDAQLVITDPNEATVPDAYDISQIRMLGEFKLYIAYEVYAATGPKFTSAFFPTGRAYMNFDWTSSLSGTAHYGLTYNNHKGFPPGQMHLIRYSDATRTSFTDLGQMNYAIGTAVEIEVPWNYFGVICGDTEITIIDFEFDYNNGGTPDDDNHLNSTVVRNDPLPIVPEPVTLLVAPALAAGLLRLRRRLAA